MAFNLLFRRYRRYRKGRSVAEFAPVDPFEARLGDEVYEETVGDILERAALVDYGDCAKK